MAWLDSKHDSFELKGLLSAQQKSKLLTNDVQEGLVILHRYLEPWRKELLQTRKKLQAYYDLGNAPEFVPQHPAHQSDWKVAPIPKDLLDRRVEITGPVNNTKMVINMLNPTGDGSIADMAMLDFEDSMKPTWENVIAGVENVIGALDGSLTYVQESGDLKKVYSLNADHQSHVMVRVRGLHLNESNVLIDNEPIAAGIFDLFVTAYHTAQLFINKNQTPKYYVPKCESYFEARWWNFAFRKVEQLLGLSNGTIRCTFLIETLPAAFQMEEILFELRERACGLNGGRWDKIFSDIKTLKNHPDRVLANRSFIDMTKPWMENYARLLIKICHRHGAFAMGGMSAFTPGKDFETRKLQTEKVIADKKREANIGHDGCWVSHPYFIGIARKQFEKINQLDVLQEGLAEEPDLLPQPVGPKTIDGLKTNIRVGIVYKQGWDQGLGCVSYEGLMEDLATLEISRAQVWQWLHHSVILDDGTLVTKQLVAQLFDEECAKILSAAQEETTDLNQYKTLCAQYLKAKEATKKLFLETELPEFFTTYEYNQNLGGKNESTNGSQRQSTRAQVEI